MFSLACVIVSLCLTGRALAYTVQPWLFQDIYDPSTHPQVFVSYDPKESTPGHQFVLICDLKCDTQFLSAHIIRQNRPPSTTCNRRRTFQTPLTSSCWPCTRMHSRPSRGSLGNPGNRTVRRPDSGKIINILNSSNAHICL